MKYRKIAALNIAALATYEALYGGVPQEMVEFIYSKLGLWEREPELVIRRARALALQYLGHQLETQERSKGTSRAVGKAQSDEGSGSASSAPGGRPKGA